MRSQSGLLALAVACVATNASPAHAQYTRAAGTSAPSTTVAVQVRERDGTVRTEQQQRRPATDSYGNAAGNQYDLAVDGAFEGQTVAVLHFYPFDFNLPRQALREKGFSVYRWSSAPSPADLRAGLARASQLWIISGDRALLGEEHLQAIQAFFNAGHGVYIWGDNQPFYADANAVGQRLLGTQMHGDLPGDRVMNLQNTRGGSGLLRDHLLTTGIEQLYEGITIATIDSTPTLSPLLFGSAGNLVSAFYDHDGRRAILDGGFTRLYNRWDTAGTARYVKNAAAWLANAERFPTPPAHATTQGAPHASVPVVATISAPVVAPVVVAPGPHASTPPASPPGRDPRRFLGWSLVTGAIALLGAVIRGSRVG